MRKLIFILAAATIVFSGCRNQSDMPQFPGLPDADTVGEINDISSAMTYNKYHDNMHGVFYSL